MFFLQDACLLTHALYFQSLLAGMTSETGEREEGGGKDGGGGGAVIVSSSTNGQ